MVSSHLFTQRLVPSTAACHESRNYLLPEITDAITKRSLHTGLLIGRQQVSEYPYSVIAFLNLSDEDAKAHIACCGGEGHKRANRTFKDFFQVALPFLTTCLPADPFGSCYEIEVAVAA